jgi:hypothetical protein
MIARQRLEGCIGTVLASSQFNYDMESRSLAAFISLRGWDVRNSTLAYSRQRSVLNSRQHATTAGQILIFQTSNKDI